MSDPPQEAPGRAGLALAAAGTVGTRVWEFISRLAMLGDEQKRHDRQLLLLTEQVFAVAKDIKRIAGRLDGYEKRLDDKDKMVEAIIALKVNEAIKKLRAELRQRPLGPS